ncbi:MAG: alpha/beta fold hydrolase [Clostridia bacterium]|nr:alpha/beta fold hydrolase [Clostridia bacterium]
MTITDDGIQLSAVLERPAQAPCPLVIFFHGFTSTKDKPHNIASCEAMREAGCATLCLDLYGHGESGGTFENHTLYKWISNAMAAIRYARGLDFVTDIYLSGHSQGGLLAALAAGMEPDHVKGLILRAPAFMIPQCARDGNMLGRSFDPLHIPDEVPVVKGLNLRGEYIRVAQTIDAEKAMDRFKGPVLILHGDEDDLVPLRYSADAAARYADCRLEIIQGESHHFDRHPDRMKEIIRAWLAETV